MPKPLATFASDVTGTRTPGPAFCHAVLDIVQAEGGEPRDILQVAQSQDRDIGVSRMLGKTNCWIERRYGLPGWGGTIAPSAVTPPEYHLTSMAGLADAIATEFA